MDELDFLKSHWQQDDRFPQIKAEEIRRMRHRSSSSIVKWIFIISILEFCLGWILSFLISTDKPDTAFESVVVAVSEAVFYVVIIYFIYNFFKSFRQIRNTKDTKTLIESILNTRRHVENYIQFNIYYIYFCIALIGGITIYQDIVSTATANNMGSVMFKIFLFVVILGVFALLFILVVKLYYRVLYGILLKKLNKNYEDLLTLEQEVEE